MVVQAALDLGLELICDPYWAVANVVEAKALYRARIEWKLGLVEPQPVSSKIKPKPKCKPKPKPILEFELVPMVGVEAMVLLKELARDLEISLSTLGGWCSKGLIGYELVGRKRYVLESEVKARIASLYPPAPVIGGETLVPSVVLAKELGMFRKTISNLSRQKIIRSVLRQEGCRKRLWVSRQDLLSYLESRV